MEVLAGAKTDRCQTLTSFLNWAQHKLIQAEVASPRLDAEVLMAVTLNISRTELITYPARVLSRVEEENFCSKIERRVLREPVCRESWQLLWLKKFLKAKLRRLKNQFWKSRKIMPCVMLWQIGFVSCL